MTGNGLKSTYSLHGSMVYVIITLELTVDAPCVYRTGLLEERWITKRLPVALEPLMPLLPATEVN